MDTFGYFRRFKVPGRGSLVWAILDTLAQRGGSAFVLLLVSWASNPSIVGQISAASIAVTLYVAVLEAPVRQTAHRVVKCGDDGNAALHRLTTRNGVTGSVLVAAIILGLSFSGYISNFYPLALLGILPLISSSYLVRLVRIQSMGRWRYLGVARAVSVSLSLAASILLVFQGYPEAAVVVQVLVGELIFACVVFCGRVERIAQVGLFDRQEFRRDVVGTATLSIFGWVRGQSDRLVLLLVVSPSVLGLYSLTYAVARAPAEAAVAGAINSLRAGLAAGPSGDFRYISRAFGAAVRKFTSVCVLLFCFSSALSVVLYTFVLGPEWHRALSTVPLFASSVFASSFSSSVNALLNHLGLSRRSYRVQILEICLGLCVGFSFAFDFRLGVFCFVAREIVSSSLLFYVARRFFVPKDALGWCVPFALASIIGLGFMVLLD